MFPPSVEFPRQPAFWIDRFRGRKSTPAGRCAPPSTWVAMLPLANAWLGVMQGPPSSSALTAAQQHPLDAQSLEAALKNIQMIEQQLKQALPALNARRRSEEQAVPEMYDLDADLLAETEVEEARAERELINLSLIHI